MVKNKTLGGILLVCGTAVGAGMLVLPISTGLAGFFPTLIMMSLYCGVMIYSALLMMEVTLWMPEEANMLTMATRTLGRPGKAIAFSFYLLLLYALTTAYLAMSSSMLEEIALTMGATRFAPPLAGLCLIVLFILLMRRGTATIDAINRYLMLGLVLSFCILLASIIPHIEADQLLNTHWREIPYGSSLLATSFGFHIIIPTLSTYLDHRPDDIKKTLVVGASIPLLIYAIWLAATLGVIPRTGALGIEEAYRLGRSSTDLLPKLLMSPSIAIFARSFSFFAITTSFLGVSLSLWDFLHDALSPIKTRYSTPITAVVAFMPPLILMGIFPRVIFQALELAGAFGVITLLVLLPAAMVWSGRYRLGCAKSHYRAPGGKIALIALVVISAALIALEISIRFATPQSLN